MPQPPIFDSLRRRNEYFANLAYEDASVAPGRHVFVLTNRCNLKCAHCFQDRTADADAMTLSDWIRVIESLPEHSSVTLTGGEPLLFHGFQAIIERLGQKCPFNIITNGLLLNESLLVQLLQISQFRVLGVSIDGTAPFMARIRGVQGRPYERLLIALNRFQVLRKELGAQTLLNIKTVVLDENAEDLFSFHREVVETLKADTHDLYFLKGSPIQHADFAFEYERLFDHAEPPRYRHFDVIVDQLQAISKYDEGKFTKTFIHPKLPLNEIQRMNQGNFDPKRYHACKFPWSSLHINHNGDVFPCLSVRIGNLKHQALSDVYASEAYRQFKDEIRRRLVPACTGCGWLQAPTESDFLTLLAPGESYSPIASAPEIQI